MTATWTTWLAAGLSLGGIALALAHWLRLRPLPAALLLLASLASLAGGVHILDGWAQPSEVRVTISTPLPNTVLMGPEIVVRGTVAPPTARVRLVVRSERDLSWWVQPAATLSKAEGSWKITANCGTEELGARQSFHLVALASADSQVVDLLTARLLIEGERRRALPPLPKSEPVTVWRAR